MALNLKYVRAGIINTLGNSTPIYNKLVPKTLNPSTYILINNQAVQEYEVSKSCFEWQTQFTLDITTKTTLNGDATVIIDDIQQSIESKIRNLTVPNYIVKNINLVGSVDNDFDTAQNTVNRRLLTYNLWLNNV